MADDPEQAQQTDAFALLRGLTSEFRAYLEWQKLNGAAGLPESEPPAPAPELSPEARGVTQSSASADPAALGRARHGGTQAVGTQAVVSAPSATLALEELSPEERQRRLDVLQNQVKGCTRCGLSESRTQTVFARGTGSCKLCFVGEGPGADEDAQGYPFVGKAGKLLDRMIAAMGFERDEVYVCNIVKCRPPNNRKPELQEMQSCMPYLREQLALIQPEVIVALGATAVEGLLGTSGGITRIRGRWRLYDGKIAVMPTFHPAYLLRNPRAKRDVWEDLQAVLRQMGRPIPART